MKNTAQYPYICIEGVDGSGKDSQLYKLYQYIREKYKYTQIFSVREPTVHSEGGLAAIRYSQTHNIEHISPSQLAKFFAQDRVQNAKIRQDILEYAMILASRSDMTTYVYQGLQGLSYEDIYGYHDYDKIIVPDMTIVLDVNAQNIKSRLSNRGSSPEIFEKIEFLVQANDRYKNMPNILTDRYIQILDANRSIEDIYMSVIDTFEKFLESYNFRFS